MVTTEGQRPAQPLASLETDTWPRLARALHTLLGPMSEVVVLDFADLDHAIVCIEGNLSHRSVGNPVVDPILQLLRAGNTQADLQWYPFSVPGGRPMKAAAVWLRDTTGRVTGAFCVNLDLSVFAQLQHLLGSFMRPLAELPVSPPQAPLQDDVQQTVRELVELAMRDYAEGPTFLSREGKIGFIARLDELGAFGHRRAADIMAEHLGLGRATVYKYLRQARAARGRGAPS